MFKAYETEDLLPSLSQSSFERSSSSAEGSVMSKSLDTAPSRPEGLDSLWWQDLNDYLDRDSPLWDLDVSQKLSDFLRGKKLQAPEQLVMTDTFNPFASHCLFNFAEANNSSLQLNDNTSGEMPGSSNPRFKTEICRNFKDKGTCHYGDLCQFAHGNHDLRKDVVRHDKYKTKYCQKYWIHGYCAYGPRCNFIHKEQESRRAGNIGGILKPAVRDGSMPPAMFKTASEVLGLASMWKTRLEGGHSAGFDDGRQSMRGGHLDFHQYVTPREDLTLGLEKFPTFFPRNRQEGTDFNNPIMGPVGSGRPAGS